MMGLELLYKLLNKTSRLPVFLCFANFKPLQIYTPAHLVCCLPTWVLIFILLVTNFNFRWLYVLTCVCIVDIMLLCASLLTFILVGVRQERNMYWKCWWVNNSVGLSDVLQLAVLAFPADINMLVRVGVTNILYCVMLPWRITYYAQLV